MQWKMEVHPLRRLGAVTILAVTIMHIVQAVLFVMDRHAGDATGLTAVLGLIHAFRYPLAGLALPPILLLSAGLALYANFFKLGWWRLALFAPQQLLLGIMATGAVAAGYDGAYLDGTVKPWQHIIADQLPLIVLFFVHIRAILHRAWDPDGC
jgi:hypothetical protein